MPTTKRCRQESSSDLEDDSCERSTSSCILARRRKTRRRVVTTLPDHVRQQLVESFGNVDIEGEGRVNRFKLVEMAKEVYRPSDSEVLNVRHYFSSVLGCSELQSPQPSFDGFVAMFKRAVGRGAAAAE